MTTIISEPTLLDQLVGSDFNIKLAAERLKTTPQELLISLGPDSIESILQHMRLRALLDVYNIWKTLNVIFLNSLSDASPEVIARAYNNMTRNMTLLINPSAGPSNISNTSALIMNLLPPDVRQSVHALLENHDS